MKLWKSIGWVLLVVLICLALLFGGCTKRSSDLEATIEDLVDTINDLIASQESEEVLAGDEGPPAAATYYQTTNIQINITINVIEGVNAALEVFSDSACTTPIPDPWPIGDMEQGIIAYNAIQFYVCNTGEVDLTVHLSTGSTPFGNLVLIASPELTDYSFDLLVGETQEVAVIVTVNPDADLGPWTVDGHIVGELLGT